ncbi:MAG: hypothetical protein QXS54_13200, partial [Candidatus Methanomethylicaceae archaeon]
MWKRLLMAGLVLGTSYVVTLMLMTPLGPVFSQPANAPAVRHLWESHWRQLRAAWIHTAEPDVNDPDYRITAKWAKIRTASDAKEAAIAYLKQQPEFRQALQDLRQRIASEPGFWVPNANFDCTEEHLYRIMLRVVNILNPDDNWRRSVRASDRPVTAYWLVRVLAPYRFKDWLSSSDDLWHEPFAPTIQELLIDARTGSVRPVIPWDRWGKPDTGKLYPPRIPERIQHKYSLP